MSDLREQLENWRQHYSITPTAMDALVSALDAQPAPANEPRAPSYHALLIIAQSVCGALDRAGITDCDDPGEAIDVMRERYEKRIAELETAQPAPGGEVAVPEGWVLVPRKMTAAMNDAAMLKWKRAPDTTMGSVLWEIMYDAMLAAAPQPATVKRDLTVQQPEAETRADEVETIGAALFRDWDAGDHREGGPFEYYRGIIRDFVVKIRQPGDIREPKPAEGGAVDAVENPQHCPECRFTMSGLGWCVNCKWTPADSGSVGPYHAVRDDNGHACAIADSTGYYLVHLQCGTTRNESEGGVAKLLRLLNAPAGSGDAVGVVCLTPDSYAHGAMVELQVQLSPGANIKRGTKLYAGAPPAASGVAIGWGEVRDGRLMSYTHDRTDACNVRIFAGSPLADAEALIEDLNEIIALGRVLRQGGPDPIDLQGLSDALSEAVRIAERIDGRLSGGEG